MSINGYLKLIKNFPLRPLKTDEELDAASEIFSKLGMKGESRTEARSIPPERILQSIIEENGLSQSQLAREIGCHQENISAFLAGKRGLSKVNAMKLAKHFCVSVELFLPKLHSSITLIIPSPDRPSEYQH